ncbi:TPA: HdeD family acid-resistance protein [Elizabethkingia anophelis]
MIRILNILVDIVRLWYLPFILGIVFMLLGTYLLSDPLKAYSAFSIAFSLLFIVSGLLDIIFSVHNKRMLHDWGWYFTGGIVSAVMGVFLMAYPEVSAGLLPFVLGFAVLLRSFLVLGFALDLRSIGLFNNRSLIIVSICGIILSFIFIVNPLFSDLLLASLTAVSFIFIGIVSLVVAYELRKTEKLIT